MVAQAGTFSGRIARRLSDLAYRASRAPSVARLRAARHAAALADHRARLPVLDGIDRAAAEALARDGIFATTLDALGLAGSARLLATARALVRDHAEDARRRAASGIDFVLLPPTLIDANPALFRWGLCDRLLDIAEAHVGVPVGYDGATIIYTVADGREAATRIWHRDREDRRMLKVAIYLNDVDADGGPFELITRAPAATAATLPWTIPDRDLGTVFEGDVGQAIRTCTGAAGTVVFADTARFYHRGRPAIARDRAALFFSYFAARPLNPWFCDRSGLSRRQIDRLTRGASERQRGCALWWRQGSALARLIPAAPI